MKMHQHRQQKNKNPLTKLKHCRSLKFLGSPQEKIRIQNGSDFESKSIRLNNSSNKISSLVSSYNRQVDLYKNLSQNLGKISFMEEITFDSTKFDYVDEKQNYENLIERLSLMIDLNDRMKRNIQKFETRKEIEKEFHSISQREVMILKENSKQKSVQQNGCSELQKNNQTSNNFLDKLFHQPHQYNKQINMKEYTDSSLNYNSKWRQVKQIWEKSIRTKNSQNLSLTSDSKDPNSKSIKNLSSFDDLDQYIQDLNKKVVMTKVKLNQLTSSEKISSVQECIMGQFVFLTKDEYQRIKDQCDQIKEQHNQLKAEGDSYKIRLRDVQQILEKKNHEIALLTQAIHSLEESLSLSSKSHIKQIDSPRKNRKNNISLKEYSIGKTSQKKEKLSKKPLSINIQAINSEIINSQHVDQSALNDFPKSEFPEKLACNDPVFKIPGLSPTMIQMKCIEKMQIQRRKKLRQLRKDPTGTKIVVNQLSNMAAGVPSPINQSMLNDIINPKKNRFIRKPMSPVLGSLHISSKANKTVDESKDHSIEIKNGECHANQFQKKQDEVKLNTQEEKSDSGEKQQKLNLPFFMSMKKKNQQHQS